MLVYRLLRLLLRISAQVFFRRIEVVGLDNVPAGQPAVFCGNHPNSLLDPMLLTAFCGRIVHFAAKDTLFGNPLVRLFFGMLGAVPVCRRKDHPDGPLDNEAAFSALHDVLGAGRAIGIFPEGISHNASQLAPLKTGAARIALGAGRRHPDRRVHLVPTGLCYFRRDRFRSSVLIQFGEPVEVDGALLQAVAADEREVAHSLTETLETHLRGLTVNADDWETVRVLDGVRRLYQPPRIRLEERVELARRFNSVYPQVRDDPGVRALFERVRAYLDRLSALGLSDAAIRRDTGLVAAAPRVARHLVLVVVWLPLCVLGAPLHAPLGLLFLALGPSLAPRKDVVATSKFVLGLVTLLAAYAGLAALASWRLGPLVGLAAALLLPLTGYAMVHVLARIDSLRHVLLTLVRAIRLRDEVAALRRERAELERAVLVAVDRHRPEDMELLFPRTPEPEPEAQPEA